jgi:hypothetical protein
MTALLEHVAHIIDHHQPVVEKHYGRGKMISIVKIILVECEVFITRYLDGWEEERSLRRKVSSLQPLAAFTKKLILPKSLQVLTEFFSQFAV